VSDANRYVVSPLGLRARIAGREQGRRDGGGRERAEAEHVAPGHAAATGTRRADVVIGQAFGSTVLHGIDHWIAGREGEEARIRRVAAAVTVGSVEQRGLGSTGR